MVMVMVGTERSSSASSAGLRDAARPVPVFGLSSFRHRLRIQPRIAFPSMRRRHCGSPPIETLAQPTTSFDRYQDRQFGPRANKEYAEFGERSGWSLRNVRYCQVMDDNFGKLGGRWLSSNLLAKNLRRARSLGMGGRGS